MKMCLLKVLLITILIIPELINAQNITPLDIPYFDKNAYNGKIIIVQDKELEDFIETNVGLNKKRMGFYGYRVKIYSKNHQNARTEANNIKANFNVDGQDAYVVYSEPDFEVYAGDFMSRFEALSFLEKVKAEYPQAFIVKTVISYPKHKNEE